MKDEIDPPKCDISAAVKKSSLEVEYNLDMNLIVSTVKEKKKGFLRRKTYEIFKLCAFFFIIIITISSFYYYERNNQIQMHKLSEKYAELLRRHNKLNGEIRKCFYNTANFYDFINARESSVVEHSKAMRIYENEDDNKSDAYSSQEISPVATQSSIDHQNSVIESNSNTNLATNIMLIFKTENSIKIKDERIDINILDSQKKLQNRRFRRDNGRGKKGKPNKKQPNRSRRRLAPLLATFIGEVPEQYINDADKQSSVPIGPWIRRKWTSKNHEFTKFHLVEDKMSIEVTLSGLYMILVQIFYYGDPKICSYNVMLRSEGKSVGKQLVVCVAATSHGETSCHTSVISHLNKGDRLSIEQRENKNRVINLREGYSHIQLLMLARDEQQTA